MPIRPIDIMKSQEASQYKHIETQRSHNEQVQISRSFQNMIQSEKTKPNQAAKSENKEYRYDAKEKGNNSYFNSGNKSKDKKKEEEAQKQSIKPQKTGGIDILI